MLRLDDTTCCAWTCSAKVKLKEIKDRKQRLFNAQFGSVFGTNNQPTLFATSLYRSERQDCTLPL